MIRSLFKRSLAHFSGSVLGKIFSTAIFIALARFLLPQKFGELIFFVTIVQLLTVIADFGLKQWFQKHVQELGRKEAFGLALQARTGTLLVTALLLTMGLIFFQPFTIITSLILVLSLFTEALLSMADSYHLELGSAAKVGLRQPSMMMIFFLGLVLSGFGSSLNLIASCWFIGSLTTTFWFFPWQGLSHLPKFNLKKTLRTLKGSSRYALLTATSLVYAKGDQLIVEKTLGSLSLGLYGAAYRYLDGLSLLPATLSQNLFPVSAKTGQVSLKQLLKISAIMTLFGLLFALPLFFGAEVLTTGLLGEAYAPAIPILKIFAVVLWLFFINAPLATVVQSSNLVKDFLPFGILNTATNIVLNLILVPVFGLEASAFIMILTETTGFLVNLIFIYRVYNE